MARFGPDGGLQTYEQVLTDAKFATLPVGKATKNDVLMTVGRPAEQSYLALRDLQVWSYRYKQSGVWDSMMHVHFDRAGIVREMMAGPDPEKEERRGFFR
jgi:outer membrane protein assembly factor BamE (lipoprotein component of BamABCDE complex)